MTCAPLVASDSPLLRIADLPAHLDAEADNLALVNDVEHRKPVSGAESPSLALGKIDLVVPLELPIRSHVETGVQPSPTVRHACAHDEVDFLAHDSRAGAFDCVRDGRRIEARDKTGLRQIAGKRAFRRNRKGSCVQPVDDRRQPCEVGRPVHSDRKLEDCRP